MANGIELAKAYVQIVPSADGIKGGITKALGGEADSAGKAAGGRMMSAIKGAIASAGIGKALSAALTEGANLEQLKGGVEKIFNDMDASQILADAANAYKDMNMSANEYLATINDVGASFAASMGDEKGYQVAKTGLQAISDYASGTGKNVDALSEKFTMITRSTSSYQSIADQFSGILPATSADFLKQAQAAGFLSTEYEKLTQVPVAEYQEAVAMMLEKGTAELGLAGNTAAETATTFSGSFAAIKAAASNVLGNLTLGQDIAPSLAALGETVYTFAVGNLLPMVGNLVGRLPQVITGALSATIQAMDLAALNADTLIEQGVRLVVQLSSGIPEALPRLVESGLSLIGALIKGVINATPDLLFAAVDLIKQTAKSFAQYDWLSIGSNIIDGISSGITGAVGRLVSAAMDAAKAAFSAAKEFLGIRSPSRLFRDQIGAQVAQGMALGITDNTGAVTNAMTRLSAAGTGSIQSQLSVGLSARSTAAAAHGVGVTIGQITFNGYDEQQGAALVRSLNRQLGRLCT